MDNDNSKKREQLEITKIDVEWCLFILNKWYDSNVVLAENVTNALPDFSSQPVSEVNIMNALPNIRELQRRAIENLQKKADSGVTYSVLVPPHRRPTLPTLVSLLDKMGSNYDVDVLTNRDIDFIVGVVNRWTNLQLMVSSTLKNIKTRMRIIPKTKTKQTDGAVNKSVVLGKDEELEKELDDLQD
ncbi:MAG: hypothetical protein QXV17_06860 [Candidatus Micrarchaeaceae archaeon]